MGTTFKKIPADDELLRIAVAAADSAARKLRSATVLLADEQWPEAFYNAALGLEEAGKSQMCVTVLGIPLQHRAELAPKQFTKWFNGHEDKAGFAHFLLRGLLDDDAPESMAELLGQVAAAAVVTNDGKFRGLYADMDPKSGQVLHPKDVSPDAARWVVERLERICNWVTPMIATLDSGFLEWVAEFRDRLDVSSIAAAVDTDEAGWVREVRGALRGDGPAPQWMMDALGQIAELSALPEPPTDNT